jgi:hypothetical protein
MDRRGSSRSLVLAQRVGDPESRVAIALRASVALASSRGLS